MCQPIISIYSQLLYCAHLSINFATVNKKASLALAVLAIL
ncbi:MAG: hypothetical protein OFPII_39680 [Osedax symbiont Rs1]|nr:MAG: hypothetical protein OFPII_39680 [Osedax symbiont Rs1]